MTKVKEEKINESVQMMIDSMINKLRDKLGMCKVYSSSLYKLDQRLIPLADPQGEENYVKKILDNRMSLEEYQNFKVDYYMKNILVQDSRIHISELVGITVLITEVLATAGKTLADYLTSEELSLVYKATSSEKPATILEKGEVVVRESEVSEKIREIALQSAEQEYEGILKSRK